VLAKPRRFVGIKMDKAVEQDEFRCQAVPRNSCITQGSSRMSSSPRTAFSTWAMRET
jgi:hypothetical protein